MGSVLDIIDCPNCGHEAHSDYYYKTGEEYIICNNCGYYKSVTIKETDKKMLSELTDDDWEVVEVANPYGVFKVKFYDSIGTQCGPLENEEELNNIKGQVNGFDAVGNVEYFAISQFIDGEIKTTVFIDNGPKTDSAGFTEEDRQKLDFCSYIYINKKGYDNN